MSARVLVLILGALTASSDDARAPPRERSEARLADAGYRTSVTGDALLIAVQCARYARKEHRCPSSLDDILPRRDLLWSNGKLDWDFLCRLPMTCIGFSMGADRQASWDDAFALANEEVMMRDDGPPNGQPLEQNHGKL